ncbi:uroporphyrinogen-III synthase [Arthrobacter sp. 7Tela_A1]|uniref:uroporphyrinogen-III synthase n=1 Tax=Arthrobacter sp. 7Tela_A1 TaxID=3093745 RepID=UPI003BB62D23
MNGEGSSAPHSGDGLSSGGGGELSGAEVVLLRTPGRGGPMAAELRARGARVQLLPLIDFQLPEDTAPVSSGLLDLGAGLFDWIIFTSATTVQALKHFASATGTRLSALVGGTRVAAVGSATGKALAAAGIEVSFLPETDQSARGLAASWPGAGGGRIFLPQADIADPFLRNALSGAGWEVTAVAAYETVDYPAAVPLVRKDPADEPVLTPADYRAFAAGSSRGNPTHAVVVTSPSTARRFVRDCLVPGTALLAAIGDPTTQELSRLGHPPAATAASPTPAGMADAVEAALAAHQNSRSTETEGRTHP